MVKTMLDHFVVGIAEGQIRVFSVFCVTLIETQQYGSYHYQHTKLTFEVLSALSHLQLEKQQDEKRTNKGERRG